MSQDTVIRLDLPATYAYLSVLGACITAFMARVEGLAEPDVMAYNIQLAVDEIFANIVGHAYAGVVNGRVAIEVAVVNEPRQIVIDLHDKGISFDPTTVPHPDLEDGQVHGYGLFLVEQLMDKVIYQPGTGDNYWRLIKNLL